MPYEVEIWNEEKIIFVKNEGLYTAEDAIEQISALLKLASEHSIYNILVDDTNMVTRLSLSDIKHLPDMYRVLRVPVHARLALIFSEKKTTRAADLGVYEKIASSQGYTVRLFTDFDQAKNWLKESE